MEDYKIIEHIFKTFYPKIEIKIHIQSDGHSDFDLIHRLRYNIEIVEFAYPIYEPTNFDAMLKLKNGVVISQSEIYETIKNFTPNLYQRVNVFYMDEINGRMYNLQKY